DPSGRNLSARFRARHAMPRARPRPGGGELPPAQGRDAAGPHLLRGEGQPGGARAGPAGRPRLLLRRGFVRGGPGLPRLRRGAREHQLRQHREEGERHPRRLRARRADVRLRLGGRVAQARPLGAGRARVLPHPGRQRRGGVAAVAQVRLRGRDGARPDGAGRRAGPRPVRPVLPRRQPAGEDRGLRGGDRQGGHALHRPPRRGGEGADGQPRRRLPGALPPGGAGDRRLRRRHHGRYGGAFRQRASRHRGGAGPLHRGRRGRGELRGGAGVAQSEGRPGALGVLGHRALRRAGGDGGRGDQIRLPHAARRRGGGACHHRRSDLRQHGHAVRKVQLPPAALARRGRPGGAAGDGRLRHQLRQPELQRLQAIGRTLRL
ncbi:MAG: Pyridoxal 5-phosphate (PLP)-dependent ornithine decarboxylase, partial [uncultured Acetobacteraceae bacterium]